MKLLKSVRNSYREGQQQGRVDRQIRELIALLRDIIGSSDRATELARYDLELQEMQKGGGSRSIRQGVLRTAVRDLALTSLEVLRSLHRVERRPVRRLVSQFERLEKSLQSY